jgi:hypothetical protein
VSCEEYKLGHETTTDAPRRTLLYVEDNPANLKLIEGLIAVFPDVEMLAEQRLPRDLNTRQRP